jgi:hypothetical protein
MEGNGEDKMANWIGHILGRNSLLHHAIEGQMTEVIRVGRRRTKLLDGLRNKKISELKTRIDGNNSFIS